MLTQAKDYAIKPKSFDFKSKELQDFFKSHGPAGTDRLSLIKDTFRFIIKVLSDPIKYQILSWSLEPQLATKQDYEKFASLDKFKLKYILE